MTDPLFPMEYPPAVDPRSPLWEVMDAARPPGLTTPARFWMYERDCRAAELRAIADWSEARWTEYLARSSAFPRTQRAMSAAVEAFLFDFRAEADRAEAGGMTTIPDDYARCVGVVRFQIGIGKNKSSIGSEWRQPCIDCLRRTTPMRDQPTWYMVPREFTTTCPERIAP